MEHLVLNPDGSFTYTPDPGFMAMDTFCYEICDDGMPSLCDTACVIIDVMPDLNDTLNDPPFAQDDANSTFVNIAVEGDVSLNDFDANGDPLVYDTIPVSGPTNGTVTLNSTGTVYLYTLIRVTSVQTSSPTPYAIRQACVIQQRCTLP